MRARSRLARGGDRRSPLPTVKKLLLSLVVVGLLGSVTYKRVDAVLSGEASNKAQAVATGTLVVGDTVYTNTPPMTAGTQCQSWQAASQDNANVSCDTLKWDPATGLRFPGQVAKAYVAIQNAGSLNARALQLSVPTCIASNTTGAPAYVFASVGLPGDPCQGGLDMYVQEVTSAAFTTNSQCVFPENVFSAPAADCTTVWQADTVAGLNGINCWDLGSMAANTTRYFVVGMRLSPTMATQAQSNALQGRTAAVTLKWHLDGGNYNYDVNGDPQQTACFNDTLATGP